ncbi:MAG: hypothetical protein HQL77_03835 [Magnetococcales bacterium]|nr:hypothetical protein [Magnetococcales bacterium]
MHLPGGMVVVSSWRPACIHSPVHFSSVAAYRVSASKVMGVHGGLIVLAPGDFAWHCSLKGVASCDGQGMIDFGRLCVLIP